MPLAAQGAASRALRRPLTLKRHPRGRIAAPSLEGLRRPLVDSEEAGVAWTDAIETSAGERARLQVRCRPKAEVRLLHEALSTPPAKRADRRRVVRRVHRPARRGGFGVPPPGGHRETRASASGSTCAIRGRATSMWDRLVGITDEIISALVRGSFSTIVRESADLSVVVLDAQGNSWSK